MQNFHKVHIKNNPFLWKFRIHIYPFQNLKWKMKCMELKCTTQIQQVHYRIIILRAFLIEKWYFAMKQISSRQ